MYEFKSMKRRNFLRNSIIAGWILPTTTLTNCTQPSEEDPSNNITDYSFELEEITVAQLQEKMGEKGASERAGKMMYQYLQASQN